MTNSILWTVAGSDSGGGAGIQADIKTFEDLNVHGCSVITAVTAQNTQRISDISYIKPTQLGAQLKALSEDMPADGVKIGMLGNEANLRAVARHFEHFAGILVCDPVMSSSSGRSLLEVKATDLYINLLCPVTAVITPNIPEAEAFTGITYTGDDSIREMANKFLGFGVKGVLITGGHSDETFVKDYWADAHHSFWIGSPRQSETQLHGTGCILSAALAAMLVRGWDIKEALIMSKAYINQAIRLRKEPGRGSSLLTHGGWPNHSIDMPRVIMADEEVDSSLSFANIEQPCPFLYPIVDSAEWVERLLNEGVKLLQLRLKDASKEDRKKEVARAVRLGEEREATVIINDDWELALKYEASGVHLGQDDLAQADIKEISESNMILGISAHSYFETSRALAYNPTYISLGTVHETTSKKMEYPPLGIHNFAAIRSMIDQPVIAIGGLHPGNVKPLFQAGADGVSVISNIRDAENLSDSLREWNEILGT